MCRSMVDIQYAAAEISRGKKRKKKKERKKPQGINILACPIPQGGHKKIGFWLVISNCWKYGPPEIWQSLQNDSETASQCQCVVQPWSVASTAACISKGKCHRFKHSITMRLLDQTTQTTIGLFFISFQRRAHLWQEDDTIYRVLLLTFQVTSVRREIMYSTGGQRYRQIPLQDL